jgi:hypothetical protein
LVASREVVESFNILVDYSEVQPFASDLGEYLWFRDQPRREMRQAPIPAEDARRAIVFALNWILRWESFVARYVDREQEWRERQKPPKRPDGYGWPVVHNIVVHGIAKHLSSGPERYLEIEAELANTPDEGRDQWTQQLRRALREQWIALDAQSKPRASRKNQHLGQ